jgi:hypothetical protein
MTLARFAVCLVASVSTYPSFAHAQDCQCSGRASELFSGGDEAPLRWWFETAVVSPASSTSQIRCYRRAVRNGSSDDVRDIRWEIAYFYRYLIPQHAIKSSCFEVPGDVKPSPSVGPLHFGVSSQVYDTTTREPAKGWQEASADTGHQFGTELRTVFSFYVDNQNGDRQSAKLLLSSRAIVNSDDKFATLVYELTNQSVVPLRVLINLPTTSELTKEAPFVEEPFFARPDSSYAFKIGVYRPVEAGISSVVIQDFNGRYVSLDVGGFYFPSYGKKIRTDEELWSRGTASGR